MGFDSTFSFLYLILLALTLKNILDFFHDALLVPNPKSSSTSKALRDAFLVAKQSLEFCSNSIFDGQSNGLAATNAIWPTREETNSR